MTNEHERSRAEELEALLARAETEPAASRELDFLADLTAAAEVERRTSQPVLPGLLGRPWFFAAAATLLFALACGLWLLRREVAPAARTAWNAPPVFVATELRAPAPLAAEFARAMEPYARAAWPEARRTLEAFLAQHAAHGPAHFYLAVVLGELDKRELARTHYRAAEASEERLLAEHARFRRALLELAGEHERDARTALEQLAEGGGPFAEAARQVLAQAER
jgi:hypothetical protein